MSIVPGLARLQGGLVVSCQAPPGDPLHGAATMTAMAVAAVAGGAAGIRANGPTDVAAIRRAVRVPLIGLYKVELADSPVRITPTLDLALEVAAAGADVIAVDATARPRPEPLDRLIAGIHQRAGLLVLADVACLEDALAAVACGADAVATTMSGYTGLADAGAGPDLALVEELADHLRVPVLAEGRIGAPAEARRAVELGAFAVVVGTAITRPDAITRRFVQALGAARPLTRAPEPEGEVGGGRPPDVPESALAIDIGGTKIAAAVVDAHGAVSASAMVPTPDAGPLAVIDAATRLGRSVAAAHAPAPIVCGVATAGEVDPELGQIISSTKALGGWAGVSLGSRLGEALGLPVVIENDGNAAALAEATVGAGGGARSVLAVVIGTGIGGGLAIDGRIHRGAHGVAGGIGHVVIRPGGRRCPCGARGCIEAYASGPAIVRAFVRSLRRTRTPDRAFARAADWRRNPDRVTVDDIQELARETDGPLADLARKAIDAAATDLGAALGGIVNALDPEVVVLGGGIACGLGEPFAATVRAALRARALPPARDVPVVLTSLGPLSPMVGAGLMALARGRFARPGATPASEYRPSGRPSVETREAR